MPFFFPPRIWNFTSYEGKSLIAAQHVSATWSVYFYFFLFHGHQELRERERERANSAEPLVVRE